MSSSSILEHYQRMALFWAQSAGPHIEIAVHDLSNMEHSIISIFNGDITGRIKGDSMTPKERSKLSELLRSGKQHEMNFRHEAATGLILRGSILLIRDENHQLLGALCSNVNVTHFIELSNYYKVLAYLPDNRAGETEPAESTPTEVALLEPQGHPSAATLVKKVLEEIYGTIPDSTAELSTFEKIKVVERLKEQGVFQIKGAVSETATALDTSESTVYRYLKKLS